MAMVNIPSTCDDPQYRYKMPRLITKKEGRGNGSKTCIVNMGDVARAVKRPPQYTTKWFGHELGAQSTYTNKESEGVRAIVNGHHDTPIFQTMLDKFIDKYVLCENCRLPEIDMHIKKGKICAKCAACGWSGELDNNHRLAAFITKNPPDESGHNIIVSTTGGEKLDKKARRSMKKAKKDKDEEGSDDENEEDDDDEGSVKKDKKEKKVKKDKKEKKEKKEKEKKVKHSKKDSDDEDDDSDEEVKEKKSKKEKKDKKEKKEKKEKKDKKEKKEKKDKKEKEKKQKHSSDSEEEDESGSDDDKPKQKAKGRKEEGPEWDDDDVLSTITNLRAFLETKGASVKPDLLLREVRIFQVANDFDDKIRLYIVLEALFGANMDAKSAADSKKFIALFIQNGKMSGMDVLWSFDTYLAAHPSASKGFAMILKVIYDEDWADEETILRYYNEDEGEDQPGFEQAQEAAAPFLKWLSEAEADDSEEDDDEADDDEDESE